MEDSKRCRLCWVPSECLKDAIANEIHVMVRKTFGIEMRFAANSPSGVCPECIDSLNSIRILKAVFIQSQNRFEKLVSRMDLTQVKVEPEDRDPMEEMSSSLITDSTLICQVKVESDKNENGMVEQCPKYTASALSFPPGPAEQVVTKPPVSTKRRGRPPSSYIVPKIVAKPANVHFPGDHTHSAATGKGMRRTTAMPIRKETTEIFNQPPFKIKSRAVALSSLTPKTLTVLPRLSIANSGTIKGITLKWKGAVAGSIQHNSYCGLCEKYIIKGSLRLHLVKQHRGRAQTRAKN